MKFYYNGKLVRTSKNHVYTHAVIDQKNESLKGCRANKDTALSIISSEISRIEKEIKDCKTAIKALEAGKSYYVIKERGHSYPIRFKDVNDPTVERYTKWIEEYNQTIEYIRKNWIVVELEAIEK